MRISASMPLPLPAPEATAAAWFSSRGCLVRGAERIAVFVGGHLIGSYEPDDRAHRDVLVVGLASDPKVHIGRLAAAFEISVETLRRIRLLHKTDGVKAIVTRRGPGGSKSKVTPALRRRLEEMFEEGYSVSSAFAAIRGRFGSSRSTVGNVRVEWAHKKSSALASVVCSPGRSRASFRWSLANAVRPCPRRATAPGGRVRCCTPPNSRLVYSCRRVILGTSSAVLSAPSHESPVPTQTTFEPPF